MPLAPLRGSQPTGGIGGRGVGVGAGVDTDPAEAAVENDVEVVAATGVEAGGPPAGVSATDGPICHRPPWSSLPGCPCCPRCR